MIMRRRTRVRALGNQNLISESIPDRYRRDGRKGYARKISTQATRRRRGERERARARVCVCVSPGPTTRDDSSWRHQPPAVSGATGPSSFAGPERFFCFSLVNALPKTQHLILLLFCFCCFFLCFTPFYLLFFYSAFLFFIFCVSRASADLVK